MNGQVRNNSMTNRSLAPFKWLMGLTFCVFVPVAPALASPCESPVAVIAPSHGVDRDAAIAEQATAASQMSGPYPDFCAIPAEPTDLRPATAWGDAVRGLSQDGVGTVSEAQAAFSENSSTAGFVDEAMREATPPPALTAPSSTEAFANDLRRRATAPSRSR